MRYNQNFYRLDLIIRLQLLGSRHRSISTEATQIDVLGKRRPTQPRWHSSVVQQRSIPTSRQYAREALRRVTRYLSTLINTI